MLRQRRPMSGSNSSSGATAASTVTTTGTTTTSPAASSTATSHTQSTADTDALDATSMIVTHLYSIIWCSCIFIPILDTLLVETTQHSDVDMKFVVAVDHRPLVSWDYYLLVPLNGCIIYMYIVWKVFHCTSTTNNSKSHTVLCCVYVAHIIDLIIRWIRMPDVWDHEQWAVVCNAMFLACYTYPVFFGTSRTTDPQRHRYWLDQSGLVLGILYTAAAFWKLTTSFWNVPTSCGASLLLETIVTYWFPQWMIPYEVANLAASAGPHFTLAVEAVLALGMIYVSCCSKKHSQTRTIVRNITVLSAAMFHLAIYMLPVNAAGGFSLDCMTRLVFFFDPAEVHTVLFQTNHYSTITKGRMWTIMTFLWMRYKGTEYLPDVGFVFFCLLLDLYIVIMFSSTSKVNSSINGNSAKVRDTASQLPFSTIVLANTVVLICIIYGFGLTILGIEQMGAPTMYSNLRSYYGGNHLLVPTGILGDDILYGGGLVQVMYSTCDPLNKMLGYINASDLVPEPLYSYQKSLLRNHSIPYSPVHSDTIPMQFLPLCIGNPHSGKALMDYYRRSNPLGVPALFQFILPISAVKKSIRIARENGESFTIKLADAGTSASRKQPIIDEGTAKLVVLDESGSCTIEHLSSVVDGSDDLDNCTSHSLAKLMLRVDDVSSWQHYLINKFLVPYPQIVGEPEEVCMS
jgi:hypothetical protein